MEASLMKRFIQGLILSSLSMVILCATDCQNSPRGGVPTVQRATFVTAEQLRKLQKQSPDQKECEAEISSVASNNGCSDEDCARIWRVGRKVYQKCDGDTCPWTEGWYAATCGDLLSGCKIKVDHIKACQKPSL
jgi:hypothetical protein